MFAFSIKKIEYFRLGAANSLKISSLFLSADTVSNPSLKSFNAAISISWFSSSLPNNARNRKNLTKIKKAMERNMLTGNKIEQFFFQEKKEKLGILMRAMANQIELPWFII